VASISAVVSLAALCWAPVASAWEDLCAAGGQCEEMERAYTTIVQGEACRSFYATGKCTGLCTRSLKAMIGRRLWTKCADRCDWSPGLAAAAASWLDLCLARPAPGADEVEVLEITSHRGQRVADAESDRTVASGAAEPRPPQEKLSAGGVPGGDGEGGSDGARADSDAMAGSAGEGRAGGEGPRLREQRHRLGKAGTGDGLLSVRSLRLDGRPWVATGVRVLFALLALLVVAMSASQGGPTGGLFRAARGNIRGSNLPAAAGGLLGTSASGGRVSASILRGARRHLKGMRSTAD
jgi:hypothetical protein